MQLVDKLILDMKRSAFTEGATMKYSEYRTKVLCKSSGDLFTLSALLHVFRNQMDSRFLHTTEPASISGWNDTFRSAYSRLFMQEFPDIYEEFLNFDDLEDKSEGYKCRAGRDNPETGRREKLNIDTGKWECEEGHEWVPLFNENHLVCKNCGIDKVEV